MFEQFNLTVEFQMSLLLFVALAGYLMAAQVNQSAVIGSILAGLIIGPSVLGLITYTDFVKSMGHLGAVILLFVVGLEFKLKDIFQWRYGLIALAGVIVPWVGGFLTAQFFGADFANAVFTGTALTATSIAITANVLKEMGKLQTGAAKAIIGAAVIDDVISLLALSFSNQIVDGSLSALTIAKPIFNSVVFLVAGIYIGQKYLIKLIEHIDRGSLSQKHPEFIFIFVMMLAFSYAMVAELLHLSAIIGAFAAGIALEGVSLRHGKSYKEGAEYMYIIFAPIFFVSLGILVDMHVMTPAVIWFMLVLTAVAVLTKVIGCGVAAKIQGMSTQDSMIVGFGMAPRGEVAMIVGLIGLDKKIITQETYAAIIFMSLLTTILAPVILKRLYK